MLPDGLARALDPPLEAPPPEFACGADLVRLAPVIRPAFFRGAPAAIPHELEDAGRILAVGGHGADVVRAARTSVDLYTVDQRVGQFAEQLRQHAHDLDRRSVTNAGDRRRIAHAAPRHRREGLDVTFELFGGARTREVLGEGHQLTNVTWAARGAADMEPPSGHTV
jgi:hypothetical protein